MSEKINDKDIEKNLGEAEKNLVEKNIDFLIDLLKNGSRLHKEIAVRQLKSLRTKETAQKVAELFREHDAYLNNTAVTIMAELWDSSREILIELLKDSDKDVRKLALDSLNLVKGDNTVVDIIATALKDENINNVISAVEYIGEHGGKKYAWDVYNIFEKSDNEFLTVTCLKTLSEIADEEIARKIFNRFMNSNSKKIYDITLISYLRLFYNFPQVIDVNSFIQILKEEKDIALKEIIDVLISYIENGFSFTKKQKKEIVNELEEILRTDISSNSKYEILLILSEIAPEKIKKDIVNYLYSEEDMEQLAAIEIINKLGLKELIYDIEKIASQTKNEDVKLAAMFTIEELKAK